ncbi:Peptidyl-prolyl cis-trans isomerase pin4 [Basidiobolus ranarum]|uniref:Peptidyl-prolyl cis-trans isomerase pin4 n=1 Tax=Basidiobolus ranarum TaxID=34480 RepID=A0ABR2WU91_9FUNG
MNGQPMKNEVSNLTAECLNANEHFPARELENLDSSSSEGTDSPVTTDKETGSAAEKSKGGRRKGAKNGNNGKEKRKPKPRYDQNHVETDPLVGDIVTTAVVIKNIPFSIKRDALLKSMVELDIPKPYAFNYHYDNGVFRGLAFANFKTPEETDYVISTLNGFDIGGRKLKVEYKRVMLGFNNEPLNEFVEKGFFEETQSSSDKEVKEKSKKSEKPVKILQREKEERPENLPRDKSKKSEKMKSEKRNKAKVESPEGIDLSDPETRTFYEELVAFREEQGNHDLVYLNSLNQYQRNLLQMIVQKLGMSFKCDGEEENWHMRISRKGAPSSVSSLSIPKTTKKPLNSNGSPSNAAGFNRSSVRSNSELTGIAAHTSRSPFRQSYKRVDGLPLICPIRQPRGPDLSQNFASRCSLREQFSAYCEISQQPSSEQTYPLANSTSVC